MHERVVMEEAPRVEDFREDVVAKD